MPSGVNASDAALGRGGLVSACGEIAPCLLPSCTRKLGTGDVSLTCDIEAPSTRCPTPQCRESSLCVGGHRQRILSPPLAAISTLENCERNLCGDEQQFPAGTVRDSYPPIVTLLTPTENRATSTGRVPGLVATLHRWRGTRSCRGKPFRTLDLGSTSVSDVGVIATLIAFSPASLSTAGWVSGRCSSITYPLFRLTSFRSPSAAW